MSLISFSLYLSLSLFLSPPPCAGYIRNSSSLSPRGYPSASTPQQSGYGGGGGMSGGYGAVPMSSLGVPGSPGFSSASPTSSPYGSECSSSSFYSRPNPNPSPNTFYLIILTRLIVKRGNTSASTSVEPGGHFTPERSPYISLILESSFIL